MLWLAIYMIVQADKFGCIMHGQKIKNHIVAATYMDLLSENKVILAISDRYNINIILIKLLAFILSNCNMTTTTTTTQSLQISTISSKYKEYKRVPEK